MSKILNKFLAQMPTNTIKGNNTGGTANPSDLTGSQVLGVIGTIPIASGGTGQTTAAAGFNALSPMTTSGDMIYGGASGAGTRLAAGSNGQILTLAAGIPTWNTSSLIFASSEVFADTGNGYGSTNTFIRRFTNSSTIGSDITYSDSATDGGLFTINASGVYAITYSDFYSAGVSNIGISRNGTALTSNIYSISLAQGKIAVSTQTSASNPQQCCVTLNLTSGDLIRAQTDSNANGTTDNVMFRIVRVS